jgi:hypothetical protein
MTQSNSKMTRALVFVHVPKAAGSTFFEVVKRQYPKGSLFHIDGEQIIDDIEHLRTMSQDERLKMRCLFGHMPIGLHEHLAYPADYISMMRDPVDRVISLYYYAKQSPDNYMHDTVVSQNLTLEQFVTSGISAEMNNGQVRVLCGIKEVDTVYGDEPVTEEHFLAAKRNLDELFLAVGLTERFDESLVLFSKLLGWRWLFYNNVNVTHSRAAKSDLPQSTIDLIRQYNQYDVALYEYATQLFEEKLRKVNYRNLDLAQLQWTNRAYRVLSFMKQTAASWAHLLVVLASGLFGDQPVAG